MALAPENLILPPISSQLNCRKINENRQKTIERWKAMTNLTTQIKNILGLIALRPYQVEAVRRRSEASRLSTGFLFDQSRPQVPKCDDPLRGGEAERSQDDHRILRPFGIPEEQEDQSNRQPVEEERLLLK